MTTIAVDYFLYSVAPNGQRLGTWRARYPAWIHKELLTHGALVKNSSSSRAIPIQKMNKAVLDNVAAPLHVGKAQPGMQADHQIPPHQAHLVRSVWRDLAHKSVAAVTDLHDTFGVAKQVGNRLTEPFQHQHTVFSATDIENFFAVRCHPAAEPHIRALAWLCADLWYTSDPVEVPYGGWHLPFVTQVEKDALDIYTLKRISAARCARTSYRTHDDRVASVEEDLALCNDKLLGGVAGTDPLEPGHMSPFGHQATPTATSRERSGQFAGWKQFRKEFVRENMGFDYAEAVKRGWRDEALAILEES